MGAANSQATAIYAKQNQGSIKGRLEKAAASVNVPFVTNILTQLANVTAVSQYPDQAE